MALQSTPISRNLRTNARFLGLEFEDLIMIAVAAVFTMMLGGLFFPDAVLFGMQANLVISIAVIVLGVLGLSLFKYGKPRGYLGDLIAWYLQPRTRNALAKDRKHTRRYVIENGDLRLEAEQSKRKVKRG